jgi:predicted GNAT family acetyltransferase
MHEGQPTIRNNTAAGRFEIELEGEVGVLDYEVADGRMIMPHTEVPVAHRGRGYGEMLARAALDYAREQSLRPVPICPFVRSFIARHPEYA